VMHRFGRDLTSADLRSATRRPAYLTAVGSG
jgi:hypothetical protein